MDANKFFSKISDFIELDRDPLKMFEFDPTTEADQKMLEDFRNYMVFQTNICFEECADLKTRDFSSTERNCVRKCMLRDIKVMENILKISKPESKKE